MATQIRDFLSYGRARLLVGITSVGSLVCLSAVILLSAFFIIPDIGELKISTTCSLFFIFFYGASISFIQASADLHGGITLPMSYARTALSYVELSKNLFRSVIKHTFLCICCLTVLYSAAQLFGLPAMFLGALLNSSLLLLFQIPLAGWIGGFKMVATDDELVVLAASEEPGFVGGVVDTIFGSVLVQPKAEFAGDPPSVGVYRNLRLNLIKKLQPLTARILFPLMFNCLGALLYLCFFVSYTAPLVLTVICFSCFNTLWSFLGLIMLPFVNRLSVLALDGAVISSGFEKSEFIKVIELLDSRAEDEFQRTRLVQSIFHPIPAPSDRIERLLKAPPSVRWILFHQIARRTLYTSLGFGSIVTRSVHCNSGKADLWIFYPGD